MKHRTAAALAGLALVLVGSGCAKDPSPAQLRRDAEKQLLKAPGMTTKQAKCLVGKLDDSLLKQLSHGHPPATTSKAFAAYNTAVQACILKA
ncbi:MAG TPA: hypothetical protein VGM93_14375 [Acidimicrobiales bacterium]